MGIEKIDPLIFITAIFGRVSCCKKNKHLRHPIQNTSEQNLS
jgi:hypothetical protein